MRITSKIALLFLAISSINCARADSRRDNLEQVIVTAQKREESLQQTPIAISVLGARDLDAQRIDSLADLSEGQVPSFKSQSYLNGRNSQIFAIRGPAPADAGPVTREGVVAVYYDGIYYARTQGLSMELTDPERIEILRGPQGTLFGRNANGGAVSVVSKKPSGEFGIEQTIGIGNYDARRSVTRLNLPAIANISAKIDYIHNERDGWVNNTAPNEWDYDAYKNYGGRIALNFSPTAAFSADYVYDKEVLKATQSYFQFYIDPYGPFGAERDREIRTRMPIAPLDPTTTEPEGHALTLGWNIDDQLTLKSLTGYRTLDNDENTNYNVALYDNGLIVHSIVEQSQFTQEFQLIGKQRRFDWVAGLFYFNEHVQQQVQSLFSLDQFGLLGPALTPIDPPTTRDLFSGQIVPLSKVRASAESKAVFGQLTWTPPILDDHLQITVGGRYTRDSKDGNRIVDSQRSDFKITSSHFDPTITANYSWAENLSIYLKYSTGYQAGGVNPRSAVFTPYSSETVKTWEIGSKSEFFDHRLRLNADVFETRYDGMQVDVETADITVTETINADRDVIIRGAELDLTVMPLTGLQLGLSYTYMDGHMPPLLNPITGTVDQFNLAQTPEHAGSATIDYTLSPWSFGTLSAHLGVTSTSEYAYIAIDNRFDAYTLINGSIALSEIPLGGDRGKLRVALWGKNLVDEEYINNAIPVPGTASVIQSFGEPRTYGIDVTYKY